MKIKITLSYDGTFFQGSQVQPEVITVQSELEKAFNYLNITTVFEFSGRTDRFVHAFRQIVSCEIPSYWKDILKLQNSLNRILCKSIRIRNIEEVSENFHARFSAKYREYRYLFTNKELTPFNGHYIAYYEKIDEELIQQAIKKLVGVYDFEYFSKKGSLPVSTIREIYDVKFYRYKGIYILKFKANSYLRSQIRMMVDFIMKISSGKLTLDDLEKQLQKKELISWTLASPHGLYLSKISY